MGVMEVIKSTTFGQGLYTTEESDAAQLADKAAKVDFLTKAINVVCIALGEKLDISASKIVAGLEADKTNLWLQKLHQAATTCVGGKSEEAVQRVLAGESMVGGAKKDKKEKKEKSEEKEKKEKTEDKPDKEEKPEKKDKKEKDEKPEKKEKKEKDEKPKEEAGEEKAEKKEKTEDKEGKEEAAGDKEEKKERPEKKEKKDKEEKKEEEGGAAPDDEEEKK